MISSGVPCANDAAPACAAFRAEVKDMICALNQIQIVLDDDNGMALPHQVVKGLQQFGNILRVQPGGGLVKKKQCAAEPWRMNDASFSRWDSPPESVLAGWPSRR